MTTTVAMTPEQRALDAIKRMDADGKFAMRLFGDHRQRCVRRLWQQNSSLIMGYEVYPDPECDCGWIEALGAACKEGG